MAQSREQTPHPPASSAGDIKPIIMGIPAKRRRANEFSQGSQESPAKSQKTSKNNNASTRQSSVSSVAPKSNSPSLFTPQRTVRIIITSSKNPSLPSQDFSIHEKLLCYYSTFFAEKLKDSEPSTDINSTSVTLKDVDSSAFGMFCHWVYYQKIRNEQGVQPGLLDMAKLWAFGQQFEIAALQNSIMVKIHAAVTYPTDFESFIHFAYGLDEGGEPLRKLVMARLAWTTPGPFKEILSRLPVAAQIDLIVELKSQRDAVPTEYWRQIGDAKDFFVEDKNTGESGE